MAFPEMADNLLHQHRHNGNVNQIEFDSQRVSTEDEKKSITTMRTNMPYCCCCWSTTMMTKWTLSNGLFDQPQQCGSNVDHDDYDHISCRSPSCLRIAANTSEDKIKKCFHWWWPNNGNDDRKDQKHDGNRFLIQSFIQTLLLLLFSTKTTKKLSKKTMKNTNKMINNDKLALYLTSCLMILSLFTAPYCHCSDRNDDHNKNNNNFNSTTITVLKATKSDIRPTNFDQTHNHSNSNSSSSTPGPIISWEDLSSVSSIELINEDEHDHDYAHVNGLDHDQVGKQLLQRPGSRMRSIFVVPGSSSSLLKNSNQQNPNRNSQINRQPRFINFTQILIERQRKTTTMAPRIIKKKFIRLTTEKPRIKLTTLVKTFPPLPQAISTSSTTPKSKIKNRKKTLVKVKVKTGDQQLLLYDQHRSTTPKSFTNAETEMPESPPSSASPTSPAPTTTIAYNLTSKTVIEQLNRKKKQQDSLANHEDDLLLYRNYKDLPTTTQNPFSSKFNLKEDEIAMTTEMPENNENDGIDEDELVDVDKETTTMIIDNEDDDGNNNPEIAGNSRAKITTTTVSPKVKSITTTQSKDVYETVPITLAPQYDDSRDDRPFGNIHHHNQNNEDDSPTSTTTEIDEYDTITPPTPTLPHMLGPPPIPPMMVMPPINQNQAPMMPLMPYPPPPPPLHQSLPELGPPMTPLNNPRQCRIRIETICPKMQRIRRQQLQCFGDGIVNCDPNISSMCRLFERQAYIREQLQSGVYMFASSSSTTMSPPSQSYFPNVHNYFYCNQPLMTTECIGLAECVSYNTDHDEMIMETEPELQPPLIEFKKDFNSPSGYEEVEEQNQPPQSPAQPHQYHSPSEELRNKLSSITTTSPSITSTQESVMESTSSGLLGHEQSLKSNLDNNDTPIVVKPNSNSKLSRLQIGLIGALIAIGSMVFIMVAGVAYYSYRRKRDQQQSFTFPNNDSNNNEIPTTTTTSETSESHPESLDQWWIVVKRFFMDRMVKFRNTNNSSSESYESNSISNNISTTIKRHDETNTARDQSSINDRDDSDKPKPPKFKLSGFIQRF